MLTEPAIDCGLVAQVNAIAGHSQQLAFLLRKPTHQCRAHHATMTGDEYPASFQRKDRPRHASIPSPDRRAPRRIGKTGLLHSPLATCEVDVMRHHHSYQLDESHP